MSTLKTLAVLLSLAAATLPGVAMAEVIECKMDPGYNRWYVAPIIRVEIGEDGAVKVIDDLIRSTDRSSVFGKVAKDTEKQLVVTWDLRDVPEDPTRKLGSFRDPQLLMRLAIKRGGLTTSLTVNDVASGGQSYRATGKCILDK